MLTGGGDCPGLNAVIRAVSRESLQNGHEVIGVREGWKGLVGGVVQTLGLGGVLSQPLGLREISGILPRGGTILGTTRTNPFKTDSVDRVLTNFREAHL